MTWPLSNLVEESLSREGYDPLNSYHRIKGWDTVSWPVEPPPAEPEGIVVVEHWVGGDQ